MSVLQALTDAIRDSSVEVIDLTAPLSSETPIIQLPEPFGNTARFGLTEISHYDDRGPAWYWNDIVTGEHTGTHFDAPVHWVTGKNGEDAAQVPAARMIAPAVVLDFSAEAAADPDFLLEIEHVKQWEAEHGPLPEGWLLYRTGWDARSGGQAEFLNANETGPHTPGISVACAKWLAEESPVLGLGTETVGTDAGAAHSFDPPFPCHSMLLGAGKYGLTQLRNLVRLPVTGAVVIAGRCPSWAVLGPRAARWRWSSVPEHAGRGGGRPQAGRARGEHRVRRGRQRQLSRHQRAGSRRGQVRRGPARGRRGRDGRRLGQDHRASRRGHRAPGSGADQRDDRHRRGRQEPDPAAGPGGRGPGDPVQLPRRRGRAGGRGRRGRRAALLPRLGPGRRAPRLRHGIGPQDGDPGPAAERPGRGVRTGAGTDAAAGLPDRPGRRGGHGAGRGAAPGTAAGVHRGPGGPGPGGRAGTASRGMRGAAGHLRGGQGLVPWQPVEPGRERRVRHAAGGRADRRR